MHCDIIVKWSTVSKRRGIVRSKFRLSSRDGQLWMEPTDQWWALSWNSRCIQVNLKWFMAIKSQSRRILVPDDSCAWWFLWHSMRGFGKAAPSTIVVMIIIIDNTAINNILSFSSLPFIWRKYSAINNSLWYFSSLCVEIGRNSNHRNYVHILWPAAREWLLKVELNDSIKVSVHLFILEWLHRNDQ